MVTIISMSRRDWSRLVKPQFCLIPTTLVVYIYISTVVYYKSQALNFRLKTIDLHVRSHVIYGILLFLKSQQLRSLLGHGCMHGQHS